MAYTGVSLQGIMQALVEVNTVTHFTHWTIAHAHMGVYAFVTFTLFGTIYYMLPRIVGREWPSARLIRWHFWLVMVGIFLYVFGLAIGGVLQGLALHNLERPFSDSVLAASPWLWVRTIAGLLLTLGHFVFFTHILMLVFGRKAKLLPLPAWYEVVPVILGKDTSGVTEKGSTL
jgi:cytochrome c oxidase cbb3-type subunit 1